MDVPVNILVVAKSFEVAESIKNTLEIEPDFQVQIQSTVPEPGLLHSVDFLLWDESANDESSIEQLASIRNHEQRWTGPVIMLTESMQDTTIKNAFSSGVDDCVLKPLKPALLVGKIRALSQRCGIGMKRSLKIGTIEINPLDHKIWVDSEEVKLTLTEYRILCELAESVGRLVTRDTLKTRVYGDSFVTNRTIDVHICALRRKLKTNQNSLKTVRGVGYRLTV